MNKSKVLCENVDTSVYYLLRVSYGNQPHFICAVDEDAYMKLPDVEGMPKQQQARAYCQVILTPRVDEAHQFSMSYPRLPKYTPENDRNDKTPKTIQTVANHYRNLLCRPIQILTVEHTVKTTDTVKHSTTIT